MTISKRNKITEATCYNLSFFFCVSALINFITASKSSAKKFEIDPLGVTKAGILSFLMESPFLFLPRS